MLRISPVRCTCRSVIVSWMVASACMSCSGPLSAPGSDPSRLVGDWDELTVITDAEGARLCTAALWTVCLRANYTTADSFYRPDDFQPGAPDPTARCVCSPLVTYSGGVWAMVAPDTVVRYFPQRGEVQGYEERARVYLHGDTLDYGSVKLVRRR